MGETPQPQFEAETPNTASVKLEEPDFSSSNWYFNRDDIEKYSPSRKDGIDLKKETYYRRSYCTYLQDLGMRLKVPQVTIATAIVFCHRFFLRQSHARNDRHTIATICMFLAGKVEETPRHLDNVVKVAYAIRFKKDPAAGERIKQKEVLQQQKELMLVGERLVLTTLGFDLNIHHPYKPLVAAIKKFNVSQNTLAQVAWNFVNDGLRTSLWLQFKPHHIAAGAIFLAAKFLKIKLPCDGDKVWWQEFEVTPRQLEVVSNQMLELYEQNKPAGGSKSSDPTLKDMKTSAHPSPNGQLEAQQPRGEEDSKKTSAVSEEVVLSPSVNGSQMDAKGAEAVVQWEALPEEKMPDAPAAEEQKRPEWDAAMDEVNTDKLKAAMEKRRKLRVEAAVEAKQGKQEQQQEATGDEETLERELENGVEAAAGNHGNAEEGTEELKPKQNGHRKEERQRESSSSTPSKDGKQQQQQQHRATKRERSEEVEPSAKRKRQEEGLVLDRRPAEQLKEVHVPDRRPAEQLKEVYVPDRRPAEQLKEEKTGVEEGELPLTGLAIAAAASATAAPAQEQQHPQQVSSQQQQQPQQQRRFSSPYHDRKAASPQHERSERRREYGRDPYPPRRESFDGSSSKHSSSSSSRHHRDSHSYHYQQQQQQQSQQQPQQQQLQQQSDWHRSSDRDNNSNSSNKKRYESHAK